MNSIDAPRFPPRRHDYYDVIVIGSGLAGLTAANTLARNGRSVLLLGTALQARAAWPRGSSGPAGTSLTFRCTAFPIGMIKSCRRYWTQEIADSIVQLKHIRFDNPMFSLTTTFNREDFTRLLTEQFEVDPATVYEFFDTARKMNFYDDQPTTTRELFDRFFPGREDVIRLLMEPITYANGSTLEDPAISYGIVFSNFMSKGVFTFQGGTDRLIGLMEAELRKNGVDVRIHCDVERILVETGSGAWAFASMAGEIAADAVVSNANLKATLSSAGRRGVLRSRLCRSGASGAAEQLEHAGLHGAEAGRADRRIDGDLLFSSTAPAFRTELLLSRDITSRTYSFYYPRTRPAGSAAVPDRVEHQRPVRGLGRLCRRRVRGQQAGSDRDDARRARQIRARTFAERLDHVEASTPRDVSSTTRSMSPGPASGPSSRAWPSAGTCRNRSPACTTPAASASSCRGGSVR